MPRGQTKYAHWGMLSAIAAQVLWGFFPVYFHFLKQVDSFELIAHRALWSFCLLVVLVFMGRWFSISRNSSPIDEVRDVLKSRRTLLTLTLAAVLIAINWLTFVWAVNNNHKIDASLGYYICPQVVILLGVVFLRERLEPMQWLALAVVGFGVLLIGWSANTVLWIGLVVAFSFGFYSLVKKQVVVSPFVGLLFETGFLLLPAVALLLYRGWPASPAVVGNPWGISLLLIGSGVMTVSALALYASSVKHIALSTAGVLQFISPTIQFIVGTIIFGEPFDYWRIAGFAIVWVGVSLFLIMLRKTMRKTPVATKPSVPAAIDSLATMPTEEN